MCHESHFVAEKGINSIRLGQGSVGVDSTIYIGLSENLTDTMNNPHSKSVFRICLIIKLRK